MLHLRTPHARAALTATFLALCLSAGSTAGASASGANQAQKQGPKQGKQKIDHSGKRQVGKASIYADKFAGRKMANGKPMKPNSNNAASKTLPLGTTAKVTNLESGESATVTIADRGPFVPGRIVDLSPSSAEEIGLSAEQGLAPVEVAPIAVPQPDGGVKPGDGASAAQRRQSTADQR